MTQLNHGLRKIENKGEKDDLLAKIENFKNEICEPFSAGQKAFILSKLALENMLTKLNEEAMDGVIFSHATKELIPEWGGNSIITVAQNVKLALENNEFKIKSRGQMYASYELTGPGQIEPPVLGIPPANP